MIRLSWKSAGLVLVTLKPARNGNLSPRRQSITRGRRCSSKPLAMYGHRRRRGGGRTGGAVPCARMTVVQSNSCIVQM